MEHSNRNVGLDWIGWVGLDGISLNSLTTRSPYGDNKCVCASKERTLIQNRANQMGETFLRYTGWSTAMEV